MTHSAWGGHAPFARWLIERWRPRRIVELGVFAGFSYFCFCETVKALGYGAQCWGVDTFEGDVQSGFYGTGVLNGVQKENEQYAHFSTIVVATFDDAAARAKAEQPGQGIDLLHIDGCHTYEAVRHDFETWLPLMSPQGIVLLHDTQAKIPGFGVDRFFAGLKPQCRTVEFPWSYGLGVVQLGRALPELFDADPMVLAGFQAELWQIASQYRSEA